MGIFAYKQFSEQEAKAQYSAAMTLALYAYAPDGQPQPGGWLAIGAQALGYQGRVGPQGTFFGEQAGFTGAEAEVLGQYDANGQLTSIGIAFRGTGGLGFSDTLGDIKNNLLAAIGPVDYAQNYTQNAFNQLLQDVATFAQAQGLSAKDVLVSGHSLGGLAVNSLAALSGEHWGGFYQQANYVAFASPTQSPATPQVLNIGFENDPVFRVLDGTRFSTTSLGSHDQPQPSATNNIVNFNDHYASTLENLLPQSILNPQSWQAHGSAGYADALNRVIDSSFYGLTSRDSTLVISNLSSSNRGNTWVEDLNRNAEAHTGSTFIIGSDGNDLLKGGRGNDFLEGRDGDDRFRDDGGYNVMLGGKGHNVLELRQPLDHFTLANDGDGTLYVRDAYGGISLTRDIGALVSKEPGFAWGLFSKEVSHAVTAGGLLAGDQLTPYNHSLNGDAYGNSLVASGEGDWLFGLGGDDLLRSEHGQVTFVGGAGNDELYASGGGNTFLFNGAFGFDTLHGYQGSDRLVFLGVEGAGQGYDYSQHLTQSGQDTVLSVGDYCVTLVGVAPDSLVGAGLVFA